MGSSDNLLHAPEMLDISGSSMENPGPLDLPQPTIELDTQHEVPAPPTLVDVLASCKLFRTLPDGLLPKLVPHIEVIEAKEGKQVLLQEEEVEGLYLILEGEAAVFARDSQSGLELRQATLQKGDDFGLASCWLGEVSPHSVEMLTKGKVGLLDKRMLRELASMSPMLNKAIIRALARQVHTSHWVERTPVIDLSQLRIEPEVLGMFPIHVITNHKVLPLAKHGSIVVVGFVDLNNIVALDDVKRIVPGGHIRPVQIDSESFTRFFRAQFESGRNRQGQSGKSDLWYKALRKKQAKKVQVFDFQQQEAANNEARQQRAQNRVSGEQVIQLMNELLSEALELMASDIHIEPGERELTVRFRVDGQLKTRPDTLDIRFHPPLVSRFKVLGNMDIAERRQAQDGRMRINYEDKQIDFRLSTIPTQFGEKLVLRVLDPSSILIEMERLIPHEPVLREVRWMFEQPQGIVLVAGPTGSGKTTTIYSALMHRKEDEINIVTIEDPLEYIIDGIAQVQVNELAGVHFSNTIRHFLRQDPDVIVVGETRDPVTAATSIEAALTGHLVLTTIHANSSIGTLVRLRDMDIEPFLLANTVIGVISQRLVRRVCAHCRETHEVHASLIRPLGIFDENDGRSTYTFYKGRGCLHCNFLGYKGRIGVFEVLRIDDQLRPMIASDMDMTSLRQNALRLGLLTPMRDYSRYLLTKGITTPEEITRALFLESARKVTQDG